MYAPDKPKVAEGDELAALQLEKYVGDYTPQGWVEPISVPMGRPIILLADFIAIREAFKANRLKEFLKDYERGRYGHWAIIAAIKDYFERTH